MPSSAYDQTKPLYEWCIYFTRHCKVAFLPQRQNLCLNINRFVQNVVHTWIFQWIFIEKKAKLLECLITPGTNYLRFSALHSTILSKGSLGEVNISNFFFCVFHYVSQGKQLVVFHHAMLRIFAFSMYFIKCFLSLSTSFSHVQLYLTH